MVDFVENQNLLLILIGHFLPNQRIDGGRTKVFLLNLDVAACMMSNTVATIHSLLAPATGSWVEIHCLQHTIRTCNLLKHARTTDL